MVEAGNIGHMISRAKKLLAAAAACIVLLPSCADRELRVVSREAGQDITREGRIADRSLVFAFPPYRRGGTCRDLFNYLYFKGDTLCFSFRLSRRIEGRAVAAAFIEPATGRRFSAERLETHGDTVWGFSLVGSLMEKFHDTRLGDAVSEGAFCCREIPFMVELSMPGKEGDTTTARIESSFRIEYR